MSTQIYGLSLGKLIYVECINKQAMSLTSSSDLSKITYEQMFK